MINEEQEVSTRGDKVVIAILTAVMILGVFPMGGIRPFGVTITFFWGIIPIIFVYFVVRRLRRGIATRQYTRTHLALALVFIFWLLWGGVLLFTSEYSLMMPGLKELIGIFFGLLCIFCIDESCNIKGGFSIMVTTLRIVIVGITILCLVELVFGWHLYTSRFSNPTVIEEFIKALGKDYDGGAIAYDATGIFYNVNDLCAFLALFFPLFFPHRGNSILRNSAYILEMILLILIISKDDAWISLLAMGISGVGYLLIRRKNWKIWLISAIAFALIKEFVVKLFYGLVYIVYWLIPGVEVPFAVATMFGRSVSEDGLTAVVSAQLASAKMEKGSAFTRMENYKEGFTDLFTQSGGMGLGPESYNRYMEMKHGYDLAMDPHCFWLEIMFQYGIVVFIAFVALLAYLFFRLVKNYRTTHRREYAVIIAIDLAFVISSIAPSTYLGYEYSWIPIGLSLALAHIKLEKERKNRVI